MVKKMPGQAARIVHLRFKNQDELEYFQQEIEYAANLEKAGLQVSPSMMQEINALDARDLFSRIPSEDIPLLNMGVTKPSDLILNEILVPPVPLRPSVQVRAGVSNEDDLTIKLGEMLQLNNLMKVSIEQGLDIKKLF